MCTPPDKLQELRARLAAYSAILAHSAETTRQAEDRPRYQQHLAAVALMFAALEARDPIARLRDLVASERRAFGWHMLSGEVGVAAERAFDAFADVVEST